MNNYSIPVNTPLLDGNEKKYLIECIDSGWISSEGPFVSRFEKEFSSRVGRKHGIAVSNGTAAIDAAVVALGISKGDEVILPAFTIISCILQIIRSGGVPVLVDSDPLTWNMDISKIEDKITANTKAIMVVHIYGLPVDMDPILNLCKRHNLKLIEDSAEMIGQTYKGKCCGSFGDISTVSFYPNKHITTGEGGMILTDDDELAEKCRELRNLCFIPGNRFVHEKLGWNLRMTNLQAALGVAQLERLDEFIALKRKVGRMYNDMMADIPEVQISINETTYAKNIFWVNALVLNESTGVDAKEIIYRMGKLGVGCRPFFCPMNLQPVFNNTGLFVKDFFPVAERLYKKGFYLPSGLALKEIDVLNVVDALKKVLQDIK